jgi:hypothetical protein
MKKSTAKFVSSIILISFVLHLSVFAQDKPKDKFPEAITYGDKPIFIQSSFGPFGEVYFPPSVIANATNYSLSGKEKLSFEADNFIFPSLYFTISAKPHIDIKDKKLRNNKNKEEDKRNPDYEFTKRGENLNWMRVTTELEAKQCVCDKEVGCLNSTEVRIIGVSPEETKTSLKENPLSQLGVVGDALMNKLLPFTFAEEHPETQNASAEYSAISGAVSILFQNLFPAKAIAKNYAFIDGKVKVEEKDKQDNSKIVEKEKNRFGWFWQRIDDKTTPESIIGVRRGTVFLQVARGVKSIKVKHIIHAKYDNDYSQKIDDEYVDVIETEKDFEFDNSNCFSLPTPKSLFERTNYTFLNNLDDFPVLIPKEIACKMFQKDIGDPLFRPEDIIDSKKLFDHLKNSQNNSLAKFIWDKIKNKTLNRLGIDSNERTNIRNFNDVVQKSKNKGNAKTNDEEFKLLTYKAKFVLSDEMNRIFADEDFFEFIKNKVGGNTLDTYKSQGKTKEIQIKMRQQIETEIEAAKLKRYLTPSQCDNWFSTNPFSTIIEGANGDLFVKREEIKSKFDLPTLKDLLKKTQIEINQKP